MKIAIATDHGGFALKETVARKITEMGHEVIDCGIDKEERTDYPDYAFKAASLVQQGKADRAVLLCGSGVGMSLAASKLKGVLAAVCHDTYSAHQGVEHDNLNVLCLGARIIGPSLAEEIVERFINAQFITGGRHEARINKVLQKEQENFK